MSEQQDVYGDRNQAFASQNSHGAMASPVGETKAFASGGKVPVQLPPPPPGVPASQVERWRSEMKKIVEQQVWSGPRQSCCSRYLCFGTSSEHV